MTGGYTSSETSWLHLIGGLYKAQQQEIEDAEQLLRKAVMRAEIDSSGYFLALAMLEQLQQQRLRSLRHTADEKKYRQQAAAFYQQVTQHFDHAADKRRLLSSALSTMQNKETDIDRRRSILKSLLPSYPLNSNLLISLAYTFAMEGNWSMALTYARQFLKKPGRQNAGKLSMGLLEPALLRMLGKQQQAHDRLSAFHYRIDDPWYRMVSQCLLSPEGKPDISVKAGESPENLLTGHTALGLWSEGSGHAQAAIEHYREALESYLDHRIEYDFAKERIYRLRQKRNDKG